MYRIIPRTESLNLELSFSITQLTTMKASTLKRTADPDSEIQETIFAYNTKQQPSI